MALSAVLRLLTAFLVLVTHVWAQSSRSQSLPLRSVPDWWQVPEGWELGNGSSVGVDSKNNVHVFHRGAHPVIVFDSEGRYLRSWGDDVISDAHGLELDADDNVWVTDRGHHTVVKFSPRGEVLLTLGTKGEAGEDETHFNRPADIAFGPQGDVYVADGYGNRRVVKFSKEGEYVRAWGKLGQGPGEFEKDVHTVVVDEEGRVYVGEKRTGDPEGRIQIFDPDGRFLRQWTDVGAAYGLTFDPAGQLYMCDGEKNQVLKLDQQGRILASFGKLGSGPGEFKNTHHIAAGKAGELYVAETQNRRIQKLVWK